MFPLQNHIVTLSDRYPLLLEHMESCNGHVHVIDVLRNDDTSSSSSTDDQRSRVEVHQHEDRLSHSTRAPSYQAASSNRLISRSSSFLRQGDGYSRRRRSPLNSGLWITVELLVTMSQIIASVVVLSLSTNENPQAPLFAWIVGYASGCVATLPILYWRFRNCYRGAELESTQSHQGTSENPTEPMPYAAISITPASDKESNRTSETVMRNSQIAGPLGAGFLFSLIPLIFIFYQLGCVLVDTVKFPVFLTFSCIGYAMPFILCAMIFFCLPCIISVLGIQEDFSQTRGATTESINALPTYKFKLNRNGTNDDQESNTADEGGFLAAGTEHERAISEEDAVSMFRAFQVCSICLANYSDNDELRELTCLHVFHVECVDKWLKINAACPPCKSEIGDSSGTAPSSDSSPQ